MTKIAYTNNKHKKIQILNKKEIDEKINKIFHYARADLLFIKKYLPFHP
mgnify:CR=1 FL=1